jgi:biopolymer transport protein ExbD
VAKPQRREIREIPIAPILDMLVAVIFFLLISTSFEEYARQTLPPASVGPAEPAAAGPPPLAPKLVARDAPAGGVTLALSWDGPEPGSLSAVVGPLGAGAALGREMGELREKAASLVERFAREHPGESSLRLGFSESFPYQGVISVMDGARGKIKSLVLISYASAAEGPSAAL